MRPVIELKKKNKAETGVIPEEESEVDANEAYLHSSSENSGLDIDSSSSSSEDDDDDHWEDVAPGFQKETRSSWIDAGSSPYAKEKLVKILAGDLSIPKQQWSFCRISATLVQLILVPCILFADVAVPGGPLFLSLAPQYPHSSI